jgi:hypothetical protein
MSALSLAFMASVDLAARQAVAKELHNAALDRGEWSDICGYKGRPPHRFNFGKEPCIPPAVLRGMMDRINLRARVERDNADEVCPPLTANDAAGFAVIPLFMIAGVIINRGGFAWPW